MRALSWLHISDLHLRVDSEWAQDVVLTEMCHHIGQQRAAGSAFDFILVTGDIAYSGQAAEYSMAAQFFDELATQSGVSRRRIFCVPGNHDIDRPTQAMAFRGAREVLRDQRSVDDFLADHCERDNILTRQHNYRTFQASYFADQPRRWTPECLAYVCRLQINDLSLAILGLDSTWLAEGGDGDHGNLLMGEMQVINAIQLASQYEGAPNVVIAIAHHPFHLLQEFDRQRVQTLIERYSHFFHHGHLHQAGARLAGSTGSQCLTIAAGASYMSRHAHNAYSIVTLNLLDAERSVNTFVYNPVDTTYTLTTAEEVFSIEMIPTSLCSVRELADVLNRYDSSLEPYAYYLAALILRQKSDFPVPGTIDPIFATIDVVHLWPDGDLKALATSLMRFSNVLNVLYDGRTLEEIVATHATMFVRHVPALNTVCATVPSLRRRLSEMENDARHLAGIDPQGTFIHTRQLFEELAQMGEWELLRQQAERHLQSPDLPLAAQATRMYALSLAKEGGSGHPSRAIEYYQSLVTSSYVEATDFRNLAVLLADDRRFDEATCVVFSGIEMFPSQSSAFLEIGHTIVAATGDRRLRRRLGDLNRGEQ